MVTALIIKLVLAWLLTGVGAVTICLAVRARNARLDWAYDGELWFISIFGIAFGFVTLLLAIPYVASKLAELTREREEAQEEREDRQHRELDEENRAMRKLLKENGLDFDP